MTFSVLLNGLDAMGQWMSGKLIFVSLEVAAFAMIVWMILRIFRFRSAKVREAFWLTVLLKPLAAILIAWPISWSFISGGGVISEPTLASSSQLIEPQADVQGFNPRMNSKQVIQPVPVSDVSAASSIASESSHNEIPWWRKFNLQQSVVVLWFLGCGLMLGRLALGLRTLSKLRKNSQIAPEWLPKLLSECAEQLNIRSRMELRLSDDIQAPMLFGFFRPVIVLPNWCVDRFSHSELRLMLMHELAHWKYRDTWALLAKQLIEAIFFFHPAVWYAGRQMVKEAEAACDDVVVISSQQSKTYANCLMRILEHAAGIKRRSSFASLWTGLAAGGTVTGNRIRKLLQHSRIISTKITPTALIALLLVAVLGLPSVLGDTSKKDVSTESRKSLGENEPGAVIWGREKKIEGKVHISNISYSGGNFWALGIPAHLEEWMNARTKINVNLIFQGGKMVYLAWPPEDASSEQIKDVSEYVDQDGLFKQPMLLWSSMREVNLSQAEKENLRKYLIEKQGLLFIDGNSSEDSSEFLTSVRSMLRHILPEFPIERIPNNHEIYSIFYEMGGPPLGPTSQKDMAAENYLEGIFIDARLAVVISDRNYWNALIGREPYSPGVMRFCTNMVVYAVTHGGIVDYSRYKSDNSE